LQIRPIWHQKTERVQAHILVCFLAYVLWKTLGQMCHAAGLGDEPRRVFEELGKIRVVDVVLPTRSGPAIRRRCVNHIPAGKPEPPTITPARDVTITVALPDFLRNVTACEVTENGIVPFDCSIREDQAILKMDAIESGRVFILRHLQ
jgi:hypothetical protein